MEVNNVMKVCYSARRVTAEETVEENTVIYGSGNERRRQMDRPAPQTLQIDFLSKVLPNYHHLKKPSKK